MPETTITLPAFAKINWRLRVLGKRADAYHELDTVFQTISLHDTVTLTANHNPRIILSCDDRSLPLGADNIVCRAAAALQACFAPDKGAYVRLGKRIPTQAGLGGGSSDAAVTLVALAYLWETNATADELLSIAATIGADVPFFFFGGTARGIGNGTNVTPLSDVPEKFMLIVKPNVSISTSRAYDAIDSPSLTTSKAKTILASSQHSEVFDSFDLKALQNDFEAVALELEPEIKRAKDALEKAGARATLLAGSGSAVFGVFESGDAQERAIQAIELESGWRVFPCRTVGRNPYRSALGEILARFTRP